MDTGKDLVKKHIEDRGLKRFQYAIQDAVGKGEESVFWLQMANAATEHEYVFVCERKI